jgi:hypothetical protein
MIAIGALIVGAVGAYTYVQIERGTARRARRPESRTSVPAVLKRPLLDARVTQPLCASTSVRLPSQPVEAALRTLGLTAHGDALFEGYVPPDSRLTAL